MARLRLLALVLGAAVLAGACGSSDDDGPRFVTVPLGCEAVLERLEQRADGWPNPASLADLQGVNDDLFSAVNALGEDCAPSDFERLEAIECDYFTAVTGADEAADAFLTAQRSRCDPGPDEADPDEPTATVEDGARPRSRTGRLPI